MEIYNFDENAAVVAIVNVDAGEVLDVFYQPGIQPGTNARLNQLALDLALNDEEVSYLEEYRPNTSSKVFSRDGEIIGEFFIEKRTPIHLREMPEHLKQSFIAVEDSRFYTHTGVDFEGIMRALWVDIRAREIVDRAWEG